MGTKGDSSLKLFENKIPFVDLILKDTKWGKLNQLCNTSVYRFEETRHTYRPMVKTIMVQ